MWKQSLVQGAERGIGGEGPATTWAGGEFWKLCGRHTPPQEDSTRALAKPALSGPSWPLFPPVLLAEGTVPGEDNKPECHQPPRPRVEAKPVSDPRSMIPERAPSGTGRGERPTSESCWQLVVLRHYL